MATLNNSVAGKVSKSGDTMTGELTTIRPGWNSRTFKSTGIDATALTNEDQRPYYIRTLDKNDRVIAHDIVFAMSNRVFRQLKSNYYNSDGTVASTSILTIRADSDGTAHVSAPSWSPGTNDNSDKVLTIKMANSLPSLVHTTGNETVAGAKTFKNDVTLNTGGFVPISIKSAIIDSTVSDSFMNQIVFKDKNDVIMGRFGVTNYDIKSVGITTNWNNAWYSLTLNKSTNGTVYAIAPTTPSGATGTEIATADWVLARINELATKNGLKEL